MLCRLMISERLQWLNLEQSLHTEDRLVGSPSHYTDMPTHHILTLDGEHRGGAAPLWSTPYLWEPWSTLDLQLSFFTYILLHKSIHLSLFICSLLRHRLPIKTLFKACKVHLSRLGHLLPRPPPADLNNYISGFLESSRSHSFNHDLTQCTLFWFSRQRRKTPSLNMSALVILSHSNARDTAWDVSGVWEGLFPFPDHPLSDSWLSSVGSGPLHLVGMFHTPVNCLHTSVSHMCAPVSHCGPLNALTICLTSWAVWTVMLIFFYLYLKDDIF